MFAGEAFDQLVDVALDDVGQVVEREAFDAVVGDAALREIVGADALAAVAAADLQFAFLCLRGVAFGGLGFEQHCFQTLHRFVPVGVLTAFGLRFHDDATWYMGDADRGFGFIDVLAAGAAGAESIDTQVDRIDLDLDIAGVFGNDRDRCS